jgi:protein-tyrosine phosphatase
VLRGTSGPDTSRELREMTSVALVCTGNVCRSPAAELLLRERLGPDGVVVRSSGTRALVGNPVDPAMADLLVAEGLDPRAFRARPLQVDELRRADLVIAMAREHRAAVVAAEPTAVRRTFLLGELAMLAPAVATAGWPAELASDVAARLEALPALAAVHRGLLRSVGSLDVVDPFGAPADVYARALGQIVTAVDALVTAVTDDGGGTPSGE